MKIILRSLEGDDIFKILKATLSNEGELGVSSAKTDLEDVLIDKWILEGKIVQTVEDLAGPQRRLVLCHGRSGAL